MPILDYQRAGRPSGGVPCRPEDVFSIASDQRDSASFGGSSSLLNRETRRMKSTVVLWHGSGPREGAVMEPLAAALAERGHQAVAVDWDSHAGDRGRSTLLSSLNDATVQAMDAGLPLVVAGWSLGGTAALSLAARKDDHLLVDAVVGLAVDFGARSPLDHTTVGDVVLHRPVRLVHGRFDTIVAPERAIAFAERHRPLCELTLVDSDHAGVVGTQWDVAAGRCLPSSDGRAQRGLAAAVAAVEDVFRQ